MGTDDFFKMRDAGTGENVGEHQNNQPLDARSVERKRRGQGNARVEVAYGSTLVNVFRRFGLYNVHGIIIGDDACKAVVVVYNRQCEEIILGDQSGNIVL